MKVNKVLSSKNQLPYRYNSLPVCVPKNPAPEHENIGEILAGDRIESSDYELVVKPESTESCKVLCMREMTKEDVQKWQSLIEDEYTAMWLLDDLPAAVRLYDDRNPSVSVFQRGFRLGFTAGGGSGALGKASSEPTEHYLFNHVHFIVKYAPVRASAPASPPAGGAAVQTPGGAASASASATATQQQLVRIVGFEVEPYSVRHEFSGPWSAASPPSLTTCVGNQHTSHTLAGQKVEEPGQVVFTYDVTWQESSLPWERRWDAYLAQSEDRDIHWFSIVNSVCIVLFLSAMIAMILVRALNRDLARYNAKEGDVEDLHEETGWKLIHTDVFRPPAGFFGPMFLSVFVGSGTQILVTVVLTLLLAVLGVVSPTSNGSLLSALVVLFMCTSIFAGFVSATLYKMFHGKAWKRNTVLTAAALPGIVFVVAFIVNLVAWHEGSSFAVPAVTLVVIVLVWFGVSVPLTFTGAYFGFTREEIKPPVPFNTVQRLIPVQPWYMHPVISILLGGILPFGAVFIELYFIMSSIWLHQVYYVFGFLAIVVVITVITCAEISIVMAYFQLAAEDYNWWWRSFLTSGASALYLFLYAILYFFNELQVTKWSSTLLYFSYMALIAWAFFLLTGSIGFVATLAFVRGIYSALRVD